MRRPLSTPRWQCSLLSFIAACSPLRIFDGTFHETTDASTGETTGDQTGEDGSQAASDGASSGSGEGADDDTGLAASTGDEQTTAAPPVCGDGSVAPGEECDDGDADDADECLSSCVQAVCGDGIVRAGAEECDDGNGEGHDGCTSDCLRERLIFVSSEGYEAHTLSGLHADTQCTWLAGLAAEQGSLPRPPGTAFRAWLSGPSRDAGDLVRPGNGPFINLQGEVVALNRTRLLMGLVDTPVQYDEYGETLTASVWTGTGVDGLAADEHCDGWTSDSDEQFGRIGVSGLAGADWTDVSWVANPAECWQVWPIYCVEE